MCSRRCRLTAPAHSQLSRSRARSEENPEDTREIWLAKHWAVRASQTVFELAHLLHGGVGVGTEYPLHLLTQGVAAWAVRAGDINEMVSRVNGSLRLAGALAAA